MSDGRAGSHLPASAARPPGAQAALLFGVAAAVALAWAGAPYPNSAPLHHLPTLAAVAVGLPLLARWPLSTGVVAGIALFLLLHTLGGRYTYSNLPYDLWSERLFGTAPGTVFGWRRNHYDRLVHFAFGAALTPAIVEVLRRRLQMGRRRSAWFAFEFVLAASAAYELLEWLLSAAAPAHLAADYNGQQGDPWDAQRDMALAAVGSAVTLAAIGLKDRRGRSGVGRTSAREDPVCLEP